MEHSPHHSKGEGLTPTTTPGSGKGNELKSNVVSIEQHILDTNAGKQQS